MKRGAEIVRRRARRDSTLPDMFFVTVAPTPAACLPPGALAAVIDGARS
jgi:hypothetical protein